MQFDDSPMCAFAGQQRMRECGPAVVVVDDGRVKSNPHRPMCEYHAANTVYRETAQTGPQNLLSLTHTEALRRLRAKYDDEYQSIFESVRREFVTEYLGHLPSAVLPTPERNNP